MKENNSEKEKETKVEAVDYPKICPGCYARNEGNNHKCSNCDLEFEPLPIKPELSE